MVADCWEWDLNFREPHNPVNGLGWVKSEAFVLKIQEIARCESLKKICLESPAKENVHQLPKSTHRC